MRVMNLTIIVRIVLGNGRFRFVRKSFIVLLFTLKVSSFSCPFFHPGKCKKFILLGFAPIFYLNCKHVLFVHILKQRIFFADLKKIADFQEFKFFTKLKTFKTYFFKFLSFINLPCGQVMSHKKFGPDRFSRFDVFGYKQTDRQAKFI